MNKPSELGPVPEDWEVKRLGDVVDVYDGTHQTPTYVECGYPFYSVENVTSNDFINVKRISAAEHKRLTKSHRIEKGDVLMTRIGSIGDCKYVDWDAQASYYVSLALLKRKEAIGIDMRYLALASESELFKKNILLNSLQFAIPQKINLGKISDVLILCPPLLEQRKIAAALSDVDEMIAALEKLIEKKRKIKTGAMQRLLTCKTRLPGFKGAWVEKRLGEVVEINPASDALPAKFVYVDLESVVAGKLIFKRIITREGAPSRAQRRFQKYDVLFQTVRPYQQNNLFVDFDAEQFVASTGYAILRGLSSAGDSWFIYYAIHGQGFLDQVMDNCTGTSYPAINPAKLGELCVSVPPVLAEQKAIAKVLGDMDEEIAALEAELAKTRQLKQGMMQELLTGRVRLV